MASLVLLGWGFNSVQFWAFYLRARHINVRNVSGMILVLVVGHPSTYSSFETKTKKNTVIWFHFKCTYAKVILQGNEWQYKIATERLEVKWGKEYSEVNCNLHKSVNLNYCRTHFGKRETFNPIIFHCYNPLTVDL